MRVNDFSKFNISFAEGLGTAPSGVILSSFWTSKKWRVVGQSPTEWYKGRSPLDKSFATKKGRIYLYPTKIFLL